MAGSRQDALRHHFSTVAAVGTNETLESTSGKNERKEAIQRDADTSPAEKDAALSALGRLERNETLSIYESEALEAIILPKERPVAFVRRGTFDRLDWPFESLNAGPAKGNIDKAIPCIGRIELPNSVRIPYGGTGFVVGKNLLMTNRHVAVLFAQGLGDAGLGFQSGQTAEIDFAEEYEQTAAAVPFSIKGIRMIHPYWDMALLDVDGLDQVMPTYKLSTRVPEDMIGRTVAVVGYPALDPRNDIALQNRIFKNVFNVKRLQPGMLRAREDTQSFGHVVRAAVHDSTTLGGNSGSAVIDVETGDVVALHFGGVYLKANYGVPAYELARDPRVVKAGVAFSGEVPRGAVPWDSYWGKPTETASAGRGSSQPPPGSTRPECSDMPLGAIATWTIPLHVTVRLGGPAADQILSADTGQPTGGTGAGITERMVEPFRDESYDDRPGFDENFLGIPVRMPEVADGTIVAKTDDGETVLRYEHFSVAMHKKRRMALFTASNVDARPKYKKPDSNADYSRRGLSGLGENDQEKWFLDPRIPGRQQLPDKFFTSDKGAFDKGHIVRREDVAWGKSYTELRRANGDTYHVTNCSPQVAGFNRSNLGGIWGNLENLVLAQSKVSKEAYCLLAGPVLDPADRTFLGRDDSGATRVQIPSRYWKIVVARNGDRLESYAFLLEQDLSNVDLEFAVSNELRSKMIAVADLQELLPYLRLPSAVLASDAINDESGEAVRKAANINRWH